MRTKTPTNSKSPMYNAEFLIKDRLRMIFFYPDYFETFLDFTPAKPKNKENNDDTSRFLPWEHKESQGCALRSAIGDIDV